MKKTGLVSDLLQLVEESQGQWVEAPILPGWDYDLNQKANNPWDDNEREDVLFEEPTTQLRPSMSQIEDIPEDSLPVLTWNRRITYRQKETPERKQIQRKRERTKFEIRQTDSSFEENKKEDKADSRVKRTSPGKTQPKRARGVQKEKIPSATMEKDREDLPFKVSTAVEEALEIYKPEMFKENSNRGRKKEFISRIEIVPLKKVRKEVKRNQVDFIGFIKIEPVKTIEKKGDQGAEPSAQYKRPSEGTKEMGGTLDADVARLIDEFREVFEELPPMEVREQPCFLVPKPLGEGLRMVVDYKALNKITLKDEYPLPRIQNLIQRLGKARWFTKLDLQKGYYQVQVAPEDQWKTAFKVDMSYPEKLENVRQVRGFLGLVRYYRQLIKDFNEKAKPLHDLLKEKSQLVWRPKHSQAVQELKDALINATLTHIFNPNLPLVLKTDASKYAVGAVLEQDGKPIAFESRKKRGREIYYPAYESELLAIVYALTKWKHFIGTRLVTIV
ncbi:tf1 related [Cystoisospora suis]|uniref:Tf1 related n=1 Tax=Cystoisospora suis TaxID=483139 RepID=A0A2C6KNE8_9APIC|nr:tf1 related [Cystoisospora suis]